MRAVARTIGRRFLIGVTAVALVAAAWLATAGPASAHGACRFTGERVSGLTASARIGCATARRVAAAFDRAVMRGGTFPEGRLRAAGYNCRTRADGPPEQETSTVRCTRGGNVVRFAWGV